MIKKRHDQTAAGSSQDELRCSFCNKSQRDVRKLIAGPSVFICDECVDVCRDLIADDARFTAGTDTKDTRPVGEVAALRLGGDAVRCALCGFPTPVDDMTWIPNRGGLCPGCMGEIEAAVAAKRQAE